ncbi:M23 family metallopeptidase [Sphingomonas sp. G124]|uniref:M23 family metallopeptidase n=1 Tax=Sphingomonas cremea TaxID=2904799 RepID=A0A9X1QJQ1_9SPHN|nr:M23 family metallopeptidase [Sphingomonas cremea]MCF2514355.1 M23 family metallopeptidase [Sphingomonas cremea]
MMRYLTCSTALALFSLATSAQAAEGPLSVATCPSKSLHAFALGPGTRFQSLVVPNVAIRNGSPGAAEITAVEFELLSSATVFDTRRLSGQELAARTKAGSAVQNGLLQLFPAQFCDGALLGTDPKLSVTTSVAPGAAILIPNETFAWRGSRDSVRIKIDAMVGGKPESISLSLPIDAAGSKTAMRFPLAGTWFVAVAGTPHGAHRWALPEAFAYDIVALGSGNLSYKNKGERFQDYYAYGSPVFAVADGTVREVISDQPEDPAVLRRPGESLEAYAARSGEIQQALLQRGDHALVGNSVLIDHGNGEYSVYAHLKPGPPLVQVGQRVTSGTQIGLLGSSGNSTEPHLHFHLCDAPSTLHCAGIPPTFTDVELPYADGPRTIQAGDIVVTK